MLFENITHTYIHRQNVKQYL